MNLMDLLPIDCCRTLLNMYWVCLHCVWFRRGRERNAVYGTGRIYPDSVLSIKMKGIGGFTKELTLQPFNTGRSFLST